MTLINVTETYQEESLPISPGFPRAFPLDPPVDLTQPTVFSDQGGYPFEAFSTMREKAPVLWHPEAGGAGFWAVTPYELVKQVELNPSVFSSQRGGILMTYGRPDAPRHPLLHSASLNSLINLDRPYHTPPANGAYGVLSRGLRRRIAPAGRGLHRHPARRDG